MRIRNNINSKPYNTFGIEVNMACLIEIQDRDDLFYLDKNSSYRILGGGSNILFTKGLDEPALLINNKGKETLIDNEAYSLVKFAAGENWHESVLWAIEQDLGGIENLSLIPGKCGAAPMQNIGAYGVELKDVLHSVYVFDRAAQVIKSFHREECGLAYRSSKFKNKWKDRYIITDIVLRLTKPGHHKINISYGAIKSVIEEKNISNPSIQDVSNAVIEIRQSKLPDPKDIGNAGSFFKNPIIDEAQHDRLSAEHEDLVSYKVEDGYKLAAGWLIDRCGWKGHRTDKGVGTHAKQALVLVNDGDAQGKDVLELSREIQDSVDKKFGVRLEPEVNIWT